MAKKKTTTVEAVIIGNASGLEATLKKAGSNIKGFANDAKKDLNVEAGGFLDKLAARAKALRKERRETGEGALEGAIKDPLNFALDHLGVGVQGFIADRAGAGFASITDKIKKIQEGANPGDMAREMAAGLPIVGGWVQGWDNILSAIEGSALALREMNEAQAKLNLTTIAYKAIMDRTRQSGTGATAVDLKSQYEKSLEPLKDAATKLANPTEEQISEQMGGFTHWAHTSRLSHFMGYLSSDYENMRQNNLRNAELHVINDNSGALNENAKAQQAKYDDYVKSVKKAGFDDIARHKDSLYAIEQQSQSDVNALNLKTARTSSAIWAAESAQFAQQQQNKLHTYTDTVSKIDRELKYLEDDLKLEGDKKSPSAQLISLRMKNLTNERERLQMEAGTLPGRFAAENEQHKEDFWRGVRDSRKGIQGSLLGTSSGLISQLSDMGGTTFESMKMQKLLSAMSQETQVSQQLDGIINNPNASEGQKAAARAIAKANQSIYELKSSSKELNSMPYTSLQFASGQEVGSRYTGAAAMAQEQDRADYAKTQTDLQKSMDANLKIIADNIGKFTQTAQGTPVFGSFN